MESAVQDRAYAGLLYWAILTVVVGRYLFFCTRALGLLEVR